MMIWKTLFTLYGFFVLWRTVFIVFCNTAAAMQITIIPSLVTCYLFFRCGIEKESLSWAFPQRSPTHTHTCTIFYSYISFLRYRHNSRTHFFFLTYGLSIFLEMLFTLHAWRDFRVEVVPGCPSLVHYMFQKRRLESCASECGTYSIIQALMESSGHAYTRPLRWRPWPFYP